MNALLFQNVPPSLIVVFSLFSPRATAAREAFGFIKELYGFAVLFFSKLDDQIQVGIIGVDRKSVSRTTIASGIATQEIEYVLSEPSSV